ncbi:MAG: hypothetical protein GQ564_23780 [Bacteroidales bacterium]|nr:hypothetical protein [Bacteroidales bacterium]
MTNKIEYIEKSNYLIREFHGIFNSSEILLSWEYLIVNKLKKHKYVGILNDFSNAKLNMELDDLDLIMSLFKKNSKIFKNIKLAVLMTSPDNIVFPVFAQSKSQFNIKAFSTMKAAKHWLLNT